MKLSTIESLYSSLTELKSKEMPLRLSYKFTKFLSKIEKDYDFFISKTRETIIKYAEKDENGEVVQYDGNIRVAPENIATAEKELTELNDIETEDINISFTLDELETLSISPENLQPLLPFIKEEENSDE